MHWNPETSAQLSVYQTGTTFEVEFVSGDGTTLALTTLTAGDIRPVAAGEVLHVRKLVA
jgi:hypothetical protein